MADTVSKEEKSVNKQANENDDNILSDDSEPDMKCDTCGMSFSSSKSYKNHLQGKKHRKKVSEAKLLAKNLGAKEEENESDDDDEDSNQIHCEVCDKYISGYISYATHLKGAAHTKNVKKQKLKQKLANMPEVLDKEENGSDDDECLTKPYARCAVCQKEFSGPEPFNFHMKSTAHKKKVKQTESEQNLKAKYDDSKEADDDDFFTKCNICQKSFSGLIPYHIHMESSTHKKNIEKKKVAETIKEFCLKADDSTSGYVCKECKKTFTNPLAFKSHLENNSHEKRKAKNTLVEFLTSHPEIVFVTPLDKKDSDGSDTDDSDSKFYLVCKLCHMSFSGPESAQDHVKSKKHINAKKEKKMLKLLKEQKKNPSVESSVKDEAVPYPKSSEANEIPVSAKVKDVKKDLEDFELI